MADIKARTINTSHDDPAGDQMALAQLGAATMLAWDMVPPAVRGEILDAVDWITGIPAKGDARSRIHDLMNRNKADDHA